jgi:hypothetical protein
MELPRERTTTNRTEGQIGYSKTQTTSCSYRVGSGVRGHVLPSRVSSIWPGMIGLVEETLDGRTCFMINRLSIRGCTERGIESKLGRCSTAVSDNRNRRTPPRTCCIIVHLSVPSVHHFSYFHQQYLLARYQLARLKLVLVLFVSMSDMTAWRRAQY